MELVIDANIIMSALISSYGKTCDLIFDDRFRLFAPEFLLEEIRRHKEEALEKSGLSQPDFDIFLALVSSRIRLISYSDFESFIPKSEKICPDPKDTEYLALALKMKCSLWSKDKALRKQNAVKVYSTEELLKMF